jgi:hypothetical protein
VEQVRSKKPWLGRSGENIGKPSYFNLPPDIGFTLFSPIMGRIDSLTVYIYKAETCTQVFQLRTSPLYKQYTNTIEHKYTKATVFLNN